VKTGCNLTESSKEKGCFADAAADDTHSTHTKCISIYCRIGHVLKGTETKSKNI
jgi:hypothetical protein